MDNQVPPPLPARSRVCHVGREGLSVEHLAPLLSCLCTPLGRCCGDGWGRQTSLALRILLLVSFPLTRLPIRHSKRTWARQLPLVLQSTCQGASCMYVAADCRGWPCRRARTARRAASRPTRQTANHGSWQLCTIYASALLHGLVRRHRGRVGTTFGEPLRYRWSAIVRNLLGTSFPRVTWVGTLSIPTMPLTWRRTRARARVRAGALQTCVFEADGIGSGTARHRDTWRLRERASVTVARPTSGRLSAVGITHERVPSVVLL